jgi:hypothetical protein
MNVLLSGFIILSAFMTTPVFAHAPCGLSGTIENRIKNCNKTVGDQGEFQLVTRTQEGAEIFMGYRTGVIWSADLPGPLTYNSDDVETICEKNHPEFGGLDQLQWKLAPVGRYIQGLKYGIQSSLPGVNERTYWTSTPDKFYVTSRYIFEGANNYKKDSNNLYTFRHLETDFGTAYVKCIVETI